VWGGGVPAENVVVHFELRRTHLRATNLIFS